jgi:hypothetical protein
MPKPPLPYALGFRRFWHILLTAFGSITCQIQIKNSTIISIKKRSLMKRPQRPIIRFRDIHGFTKDVPSDPKKPKDLSLWQCIAWIMKNEDIEPTEADEYMERLSEVEQEIYYEYVDYAIEQDKGLYAAAQRNLPKFIDEVDDETLKTMDLPDLCIYPDDASRVFNELERAREQMLENLPTAKILYELLQEEVYKFKNGKIEPISFTENTFPKHPLVVLTIDKSSLREWKRSGVLDDLNLSGKGLTERSDSKENREKIIKSLINGLADSNRSLRKADGSINIDSLTTKIKKIASATDNSSPSRSTIKNFLKKYL